MLDKSGLIWYKIGTLDNLGTTMTKRPRQRRGDGAAQCAAPFAFKDIEERAARLGVTPERVLEEMKRIAFSDLSHIAEWHAGKDGLQVKPSTELEGFPTDSFLAFAVAVPFIQGALFATMNAGTDLARDIQNGFLNRLALTPMRGSALLAGHLADVVVMGLIQSVFYMGCALAFGVEIESGAAGVVTILVLATLISAGFGMLGAYMALRTGSGESIQALFPVLFIFLFMSSMNAPRNLMEVDWFRAIATLNPVSYLIEAVRSLIITGWNLEALSLGFAVALTLIVVATFMASHALRMRMART